MKEDIIDLQEKFIKEASGAPMLFMDLAKVEQYIAESYKTRSFIELIQNADDAKSNKFGIHIFEDFVIVGNDGRFFDSKDIEAICRSGSSNKVRGSTIGYRGIGFKSVVNLANKVYIISGENIFKFDKEETKRILNNNCDVPLIRIPHIVENIPHIEIINEIKEKYSYNTIFLFDEINENTVQEEIRNFDKSSILFLNSVNEINLESKNINRKIIKYLERNNVIIKENDNAEVWKVCACPNNIDKLAFKMNENKIVSANIDESVIHSFTPTLETTGAYFKINGNYSTDPSRKKIDFDNYSEDSFKNITKLISEIIIDILRGNNEFIGFFKPFIEFNNVISSNNIRKKLLSSIKFNLEHSINNIRLKPDFISVNDYKTLCEGKYNYISENVITNYPEINLFFNLLDVKTMSLEEIIDRINEKCNISINACPIIFSKIINKYRYDFSRSNVEKIKKLGILVDNKEKIINAEELEKTSNLSENYMQVLKNNCELEDIKFTFNKLDIKFENVNIVNNNISNHQIESVDKFSWVKDISSNKDNNVQEQKIKKEFLENKYPNIKKWRSSEMNLADYLKYFEIIKDVKDVSVSNLGYDLEVTLSNGDKIYVEVKSMISYSQPFKITNNEYTCAHNYGDKYFLALVINDDDFNVKFIRNPIETLKFEKKCEQWSWYCENYINNLLELNDIVGG